MIRQHIVSYCMASSLAALMLAPAAGAETNSRGGAPNATSSPAAAPVGSELARLQHEPANWPMQLGNYSGWRYTPLDQINRTNVKDLKIGWQVSTGVLRGHEGGPLVIDGAPQPFIIYAIDLDRPGEIERKYDASSDHGQALIELHSKSAQWPVYLDDRRKSAAISSIVARPTPMASCS
jgi:glucose dehydrogenase